MRMSADDVERTYDIVPDCDDLPEATPEDFDGCIGAEVTLCYHGENRQKSQDQHVMNLEMYMGHRMIK